MSKNESNGAKKEAADRGRISAPMEVAERHEKQTSGGPHNRKEILFRKVLRDLIHLQGELWREWSAAFSRAITGDVFAAARCLCDERKWCPNVQRAKPGSRPRGCVRIETLRA